MQVKGKVLIIMYKTYIQVIKIIYKRVIKEYKNITKEEDTSRQPKKIKIN